MCWVSASLDPTYADRKIQSAIRMQLSLRQLRYVVAAADAGNVSEAARRLNVSQPSISSAIAEVEAFVGVALFMLYLHRHGEPDRPQAAAPVEG